MWLFVRGVILWRPTQVGVAAEGGVRGFVAIFRDCSTGRIEEQLLAS